MGFTDPVKQNRTSVLQGKVPVPKVLSGRTAEGIPSNDIKRVLFLNDKIIVVVQLR